MSSSAASSGAGSPSVRPELRLNKASIACIGSVSVRAAILPQMDLRLRIDAGKRGVGSRRMRLMSFCVSEAAERNKEPILRIIAAAFAPCRTVLEVGSGTGQHATYFAAQLPHLSWQPSDTGEYFAPLRRHIAAMALPNLQPAVQLDVRQRPWPVGQFDALFTANTLHIMSWDAVEDFFLGLEPVLRTGGVLCIYGPFRYGGDYTSESNARFDAYLRSRDPHSGIRDFEALARLATLASLTLLADHPMPANNQLLVWRKGSLA